MNAIDIKTNLMAVKIKKKEMFEVNFFELNKSLNKVFNTRVCISHNPVIVHIRNLYSYVVEK